MTFELKDVLYIIGVIMSATVTFFTTKHRLKDYVRDRADKHTEEIASLRLELKDLRMKDELQQQVIDQNAKQVDVLVHKLMEVLTKKTA